jgi:hypothetical protein
LTPEDIVAAAALAGREVTLAEAQAALDYAKAVLP